MSHITRRTLLENAAKGGFALGAGGLLAACGSSSAPSASGSSSAASSTSSGTPKHGGTLHVGMTGGSSSDTLDPNSMVNNCDYARVACLFDALCWLTADGQPELRVAEEVTPNKNATEWTIRLRKGVMFHDGREATADDLIFSFNRVANPKKPGEAANSLRGIKLSAIKKRDKYTITIPFANPYSTFYESQANTISVYLLPVGFDPKKPIGTGPFKLVSFTPGQQCVMARNEHYWNQPLPYLDQVITTDYSDESSQVNALLSGQVQAVNLLSQDVLGTVTGSGKKAVISPGGGWNPFTMRVDMAPFTDARVRQAFRLMVDREKMNRLVFGGHGTLGNDVFAIWSNEYDHSLPQRQQDIAQAKSLLKAAGQDNLSIQLVTADIAQGVTNMAQLFAQDAAAAGVKVNLRQITVTEFYGPNYLKWQFAQDYWYYQPYLPQVQQATLPNSPFNECHFNNPRYISLYNQALATLDDSKRVEIAHEMQMIDYNEGGYIIPVFPPVIDGYAPNVQGAVTSKTGSSFNLADFEHLWLA
jgi:peptide/nickel transport system substrate-binding protein